MTTQRQGRALCFGHGNLSASPLRAYGTAFWFYVVFDVGPHDRRQIEFLARFCLVRTLARVEPGVAALHFCPVDNPNPPRFEPQR